ncbi:hypothetical protein DVS28_a4885 [Euzebya pacifica]|uniref:Cell wall binding repeat 2 n=1 Tax=Euzebya pacifica TaxID=1608957 RepID=A0A346Y4Z5_9ACTN|nr:cell wall-binding repeat-containing protein [Euzebya pacifica]AXV09542.1 hypothetical protein DVS28_a4885 [Euzebya pacifica]
MRRSLSLVVLVAALVLSVVPVSAQYAPDPFSNTPDAVARIDGDTPAAYAVNLSRAVNDFGVDKGVIVSDVAFADALAASALTSFGAIFFASPGQPLDADTLAELDRVVLDPQGEFTIIGGTAVIDPQVEAQLDALPGDRPVIRLAGATRYETAVAVADYVLGDDAEPASYEVFVARAFGSDDNPTAAWADSVAAGPAASSNRQPILFTPSDELHPSISTWLAGRTPRRVTVLGGSSAISESAVEQIDAPVRRVAGASRDETAATIFRQVLRDGYGAPRAMAVVNLFDEQGWAYGLATSPIVGSLGGGILAINPEVDSEATQGVLACARPTEVLVAGPTSMISDERVAGAQICPDGDGASAPTGPVELRGDGIGRGIDFGQPADVALEAMVAEFGAPTNDTGRVQPGCELAGPDGPASRAVTFANGLTATFAEAVQEEMFFDGWILDGDDVPQDGRLTTPEGATVGSTSRELEAFFGIDYVLREGEPEGFPPPIAVIDTHRGPLDAILDGNTPNAQVSALYGGGALQFCE